MTYIYRVALYIYIIYKIYSIYLWVYSIICYIYIKKNCNSWTFCSCFVCALSFLLVHASVFLCVCLFVSVYLCLYVLLFSVAVLWRVCPCFLGRSIVMILQCPSHGLIYGPSSLFNNKSVYKNGQHFLDTITGK